MRTMPGSMTGGTTNALCGSATLYRGSLTGGCLPALIAFFMVLYSCTVAQHSHQKWVQYARPACGESPQQGLESMMQHWQLWRHSMSFLAGSSMMPSFSWMASRVLLAVYL